MTAVRIQLEGIKDFYTTTDMGVGLNTFNEINEIADAFVQGAVLYNAVMSDKKLNAEDLQHVGLLITLVEKVRVAAKFENVIDLKTLTKNQVQDLLRRFLDGIFTILNVQPTGTNPASFKELSEIFDVFTSAVAIFNSAAEDGKITIFDVVSNAGAIIGLVNQVAEAVKIDGTIDINSLTKEQVAGLFSQVVSAIFNLINAIKKING